MRQETLWCIWLSLGYICASPYYYRESKHQAEHHHEYSYTGQGSGQIPESIPEGEGASQFDVPVKPEKYSTYVSPDQTSSYSQSQGRGYTFRQESSQLGGSSYQSSIPVSNQQHYVHSTHYTSPVVVQQKVVKYYSYPAGTTQTSHVHIIGTGRETPVIVNKKEERFYTSGSHISGGQKELDLENIRGIHSFSSKQDNFGHESGQREVPEETYKGTLETVHHEESIHNPIKLTYSPGVSTQKVERHYEIRRVGNLGDYNQKEGHLVPLNLGQKDDLTPSVNVLQNSRQDKFITSSQHLYHKAESGVSVLGQKEEDSFGQKEEEPFGQKEEETFGQKEEKPFGQKEEEPFGQKEEEPFGQKEEEPFGQKEEDSFGQKEEDIFGQKEDSFVQKEQDYFGQTEEKESLLHIEETGHKEEPLKVFHTVLNGMQHNPNQKHESQSLETGQKEESLTEQEPVALGYQEENVGQKEEKESLYHTKYSSLEVGQKEESLTDEKPNGSVHQEQNLGQTEEKESSFHSKYSSLQVGQKAEPIQGFNAFSPLNGQGSHYQKHGSQILTIGQKEETLTDQEPLELDQKEDSLIGQKEESESLYTSNLEVGEKEAPVHSITTVSHLIQTGSLYPSHSTANSEHKPMVSGQGSFYQKHESQSFAIGHQEEPLTGQEPVVLSQKEESLIGQQEEHFGQTEDKESLYSTKNSRLEIGQQEEPLLGLNVLPQHRKESSFYQKHESHSLVTGHKEEPFKGQESLLLGQEKVALTGHQKETLGQTEEKENQHHRKYSSLEIGQNEEPLQGFKVISQHETHHSYYQNQGNQEAKKPITVQEPTSGQKEILLGQDKYSTLVTGQQEEPVYTNPHKYSYREEHSQTRVVGGSLGFGQKEPTLAKTDSIALGQKEEHDSLYHINKDLGGQEITQLETGQREEPLREIKPNYFGRRELDEKPFSLGLHRGDTEFDVKEDENTESLGHHPHGHRHHYHSDGTHRYHNGRTWHHSKSCTHGEHHQHGGFGVGQKGHDLEIASGRVTETGNENNGDQGLVYTSSHKESNHSVQEIHTSSSDQNNRHFPSETPIRKVTGEASKPFGSNLDLDKMVDDLAKTLEVDGIMTKPNPTVNTQATKEWPTTTTPPVHLAEIEELGLESSKSQSSFQSRVITSQPEQKVNIFETHKEEIGLDYPTTRKTYSKKHSRKYSVRQESRTSLPENTEQASHSLSQSHSGRWHGYSQYGSSASHYGSSAAYVQDKYYGQPVKREASQGSDRQATIDSFLSELDKEIVRENKKPGQSTYVQVSPSQHQSQSSPGTSLYPTSSSGSGDTSWFKKVGDNISSTYNKAKGSISDTFNQAKEKISDTIGHAKDKAKEIVENVKDSF